MKMRQLFDRGNTGNKMHGLSDFSDPFSINSVESMHIHVHPKTGRFRASLEFENKNTSASQSFSGTSWDHLMNQIEKFVECLNEKGKNDD